MSTITTENTQPTQKVVGIINLHGLTIWVIDHEGTEYIYAKPLADLAGIDWRSAKKTIQDGDNATLYATKWLKPPVFTAEGGTSTPAQEVLCIKLDRARMYLARINTKMMRGKGAEDAANALLALQIEWAEALHGYETTGMAVKNTRLDTRRKEEQNLATLIKTRKDTTDSSERAALTAMIKDKLTELGYPPAHATDPQAELEL